MATILCFGDSNTWGFDPAGGGRYPREVRWVGVLERALEAKRPGAFSVIAEGQNGRTTVWDDPFEGPKNGSLYLLPCLESHKPVDLLVIMLGTNDLKHRFGLSAWDIARGAARLVEVAQASEFGPGDRPPRVLLIAPPPVARLSNYAGMFEGAAEKSKGLGEAFAAVAAELPCDFLDAGRIVRSSDKDGIHFDPEGHRALGNAVADRILSTLP